MVRTKTRKPPRSDIAHAIVLGTLISWVAASANAAAYYATVVGVSDGDTITVLDESKRQHKIRLQGIDAPEKRQPFGQRSKASLSEQVHFKRVELECGKTDRYSREICVVYRDGLDVNLEQVRSGMAWWYVQYQNEQTATQREAYRVAEQEARTAKRGLWSDSAATPPWEYRRSQKMK